jgi:uncharacterized protein YqgC (DUF456 family)
MPDWLNLTIFGVTQLFMLVGLFGSILPIFPGIFIMWLAALGYGLATGFTPVGITLFIIITILMLIAGVVDNIFMSAGARRTGASWISIILALIAGVLGTIFFPPFGGIVAAPLAVLVFEYLRSRNMSQAWQALKGLMAGWGMSFLVRFSLGMVIMILWWIWAWVGGGLT